MRTGRADLDARLRVSAMPADEPIFILRAQDLCADGAVRSYAQEVIARGGPVALAESALQQADAMSNWRTRKMPDIDLPEGERLHLEYQHGRRPEVRSGALEASWAFEHGKAEGRSETRAQLAERERIGREAVAAFLAAPGVAAILRLMIFETGPIAHLRRDTGEDVPRRVEDEQSHVLLWLMNLSLEHGDRWGAEADSDLRARKRRLEQRAEPAS